MNKLIRSFLAGFVLTVLVGEAVANPPILIDPPLFFGVKKGFSSGKIDTNKNKPEREKYLVG